MNSLIKSVLFSGSFSLIIAIVFFAGCQQMQNDSSTHTNKNVMPEYFSLRPDVEKA